MNDLPCKNLEWMLLIPSYRCNRSCFFCYNNKRLETISEFDDPSVADKIVSKIIELNPKKLVISGGEPLLVRNISGIVEQLTRNSINVNVITNGVLLTRSKMEQLATSHVDTLAVSIPNVKGEMFSEKLARKIRLASKRFKVRINSIITKRNFRDIPGFLDRCRGLCGDLFLQPIYLPHQSVYFAEYALENLPKEKIIEMIERLEQWAEEFGYSRYLSLIKTWFLQKRVPASCHMGVNSLTVDPFGNILICPYRYAEPIADSDSNCSTISARIRKLRAEEQDRSCFETKCLCFLSEKIP